MNHDELELMAKNLAEAIQQHVDGDNVVVPNPDAADIPWGPEDTVEVPHGRATETILGVYGTKAWVQTHIGAWIYHCTDIKRTAIAEIKIGDRVWHDGNIWYVGYFYKDSGYHLQRVVEWNKMKETWAKRNQIVKVALQNQPKILVVVNNPTP